MNSSLGIQYSPSRRQHPTAAGPLFVIGLGLWLAVVATTRAGSISPSAVSINQISFRGGPDSIVGEITIDYALAGGSGFVNVVDPNSGKWLVQNLPVFDSLTLYNHPTITTRLSLQDFVSGGVDGTPIGAPIELIIDYSPLPSATLADVLSYGTPSAFWSVGSVLNAVGGTGPGILSGYQAIPNLAAVAFNSLAASLTNFVFQTNHPNIQAGYNQCAPAALANSFQFLKSTTPLTFPHTNNPGFGADGSLVGTLDILTGRPLGVNRHDTNSGGVWPMDGKLRFIATNNLQNQVIVKHMGGGDANNMSTPLVGTNNYSVMGVTSYAAGAVFDINWIISELKKGEDVELDLAYLDTNGNVIGRHYVEVVGAGYLLGMPFLLHVSDKVQADEDPADTNGTFDIDFEWIINSNAFAVNSRAVIDQVLSQSYIPEPSLSSLTLFGVAILAWLRGRRR